MNERADYETFIVKCCPCSTGCLIQIYRYIVQISELVNLDEKPYTLYLKPFRCIVSSIFGSYGGGDLGSILPREIAFMKSKERAT